MRFQDGFKKETSLNELTVVTVESRPNNEEAKVPPISTITFETVDFG